ncbi:hypothetical protein TNCV_20481 [Trichonephila clavipes]|uniref:Mutator-like transposase domain-containing protein n=1 Tax=Trichonephila clavipes TaxID=2585209 RepID=A0A8X6RAW1_TRICX|nr:hypothetical protein TNCV_20481 [Trichonephila clavipes]
MQIVAKEAKDASGHSDIPVAIDGTWQNHGHTSWNGVVNSISVDPGKVLDASILSSFCIEKLECVGLVEKQMVTQLQALKLKIKDKKLSDKKTLGDRGRLTDAESEKLPRYYGLAFRNNTDCINSMKIKGEKRHKKCIIEDTLAEERKNPSDGAGMH